MQLPNLVIFTLNRSKKLSQPVSYFPYMVIDIYITWSLINYSMAFEKIPPNLYWIFDKKCLAKFWRGFWSKVWQKVWHNYASFIKKRMCQNFDKKYAKALTKKKSKKYDNKFFVKVLTKKLLSRFWPKNYCQSFNQTSVAKVLTKIVI